MCELSTIVRNHSSMGIHIQVFFLQVLKGNSYYLNKETLSCKVGESFSSNTYLLFAESLSESLSEHLKDVQKL